MDSVSAKKKWRIDTAHSNPLDQPHDQFETLLCELTGVAPAKAAVGESHEPATTLRGTEAFPRTPRPLSRPAHYEPSILEPRVVFEPTQEAMVAWESHLLQREEDLLEREAKLQAARSRLEASETLFRLRVKEKEAELASLADELKAQQAILCNQWGWLNGPT